MNYGRFSKDNLYALHSTYNRATQRAVQDNHAKNYTRAGPGVPVWG